MDFEKVVTSVFQDVTRGKEFNKEMQIKDLGIDSLDLVESLTTIEEKLGIEFTDDEMMSLVYVKDVYDLIAKKVGR